jgi:hypothetical protein
MRGTLDAVPVGGDEAKISAKSWLCHGLDALERTIALFEQQERQGATSNLRTGVSTRAW